MKKSAIFVCLAIGFVCSGYTYAQPKEILVGIVNPLTGYTSAWGTMSTEGAKLAIEIINEQGGIRSLGGTRLKANVYDTESKPEVAATVTERAIVRDGVFGIVGTSQSSAAFMATTVAEKNKTPIILPDNINADIMKRGYKYSFRIAASSTVWDQKVLEFISALKDSKTGEKAKTVYMVYANDASGRSHEEVFVKFANQYGLNVIERSPYDPNIADFTSFVTKMKHANPDFIFSAGAVKDTALMVKTFKELDFNPKGIYAISAMYGEFIPLLGKDADYVFTAADWSPYADFPGVEKGWGIKIADRYRKKTGEKDIYMANTGMQGYVSMMVLKDAVERSGSLDKEKIREALTKTNLTPDKGGLTIKPVKFDETGENINAYKSAVQIINGQLKVVFPPEGRESAPAYPAPIWKER